MIQMIENVNTHEDAVCFAASFIRFKLKEEDYSESVQMADGTWADVYAVKLFDLGGWYIKLAIETDADRTLIAFSFHPLEHPQQTRAGEVRP